VEKQDKPKNVKKTYLLLIILVLLLLGVALFVRAYFLIKPSDVSISSKIIKYNDPLQIQNLPKFTQSTSKDVFPVNDLELYQAKDIQWLSIKTENNIQIGYLDSKLKFNIVHYLPIGSDDIKIYENNKLFFVLFSSEGNGPKLIFKDESGLLEILQLEPADTFTGYYYSPTERTFYISKMNNEGSYALFTLNADGKRNGLIELFSGFNILKSGNDQGVIKQGNICRTIIYATKSISDTECPKVYLNNENINIITSQISISVNGKDNSKTIFNSGSLEIISAVNYKLDNVNFLISKLEPIGKHLPTKIMKSNLAGEVIELTDKLPAEEIKSIFMLNDNLLTINKYLGIEKIMKFNSEAVTSYMVDSWSDVKFSSESAKEIEILGQDYIL